ncbi:M28 family peptidase [Chloroflexota bacterium]
MNVDVARLKKHIAFLSNECPHRHTGEPDEQKAAEYIAEQMRLLGLKVEIIEVPVMGWRVESLPRLQILEPEMLEVKEVAPAIYSGSTPDEGIEGELVYCGQTRIISADYWEKFAIRNRNGNTVGFLLGRPDGPCIMQPAPFGLDDGTITWVTCTVGKDDYVKFKKWLEAGKKIRVKYTCQTSFWPGLRCSMVKGTLVGNKQPEQRILTSAHHDCQGALGCPEFADSRGANDNASGCAGVLEIARHCVGVGTPRTIDFVTFGGEERNLIMSRDYTRRLKEGGELPNFIAQINLDNVAYGQAINLFVTSREYEMQPKIGLDEIVRTVVAEKEIMSKYVVSVVTPPRGGFDYWPFFLEGKPIVGLCTRPFAEYHRGSDRYPDTIRDDLLLTTVDCAGDIVHKLTRLPLAL